MHRRAIQLIGRAHEGPDGRPAMVSGFKWSVKEQRRGPPARIVRVVRTASWTTGSPSSVRGTSSIPVPNSGSMPERRLSGFYPINS